MDLESEKCTYMESCDVRKNVKALLVTINNEVTVDQRDPSGQIHSSDNKWTIGQGTGPDDEGLDCNPVLSTC